MLRECWPGTPSGDESSVDNPYCRPLGLDRAFSPLAAMLAAICLAIAWSMEIPPLTYWLPVRLPVALSAPVPSFA